MKLYIIAAVVAAVFFAYWAGSRVADAACRADVAIASATTQNNQQSKIIETKAKINEETYNNGVADIRDRLRVRYTIRD